MAGLRVGFAADHAGAALKAELFRRVATARPDDVLVDLGGDGSDPNDDYPDFAQRLGNAVQEGEVDKGILICGSGVGASVAANKIRGVRAAVCHDTYSAHQGVEHDDMNVLTLGRAGHRRRAGGRVQPGASSGRRSAASRATAAGSQRSSRSSG